VQHHDGEVAQVALQRTREVAIVLGRRGVEEPDAVEAPTGAGALRGRRPIARQILGRAMVSVPVHVSVVGALPQKGERWGGGLDRSAAKYDRDVALPFEIMGVVNVTPDSFSDGGEWFERDAAIAHGRRLAAEGAAILDVGGESTRPGAAPVAADEEQRRTEGVVRVLARMGAVVSIDTTKLEVAEAALDAGARYVNDVTAFRQAPDLAGLVADRGARCCLTHMLGDPRTMQDNPRYENVVDDVKAFLEERASFAVKEGVPEDRIDLDPGIGFGKTLAHNLELLRRTDEIVALGFNVLIGVSRKSFIHRLADVPDPHMRAPGTIAANVLALERGARVFRVHDVAEARQALAVAAATLDPDGA
jgi:dihydropteroate synthase